MIIKSYKIFESTELENPKIGDMVVCIGNIDDLKTHNHVGHLRESGIEFLNRFSDKLHNMNGEIGSRKGWYVRDSWVKFFNDNEKSSNMPLIFSDKIKDILSYNLSFLLDYEKIYSCDVSFIDMTSRNDSISCLSKTNYDKLENKADVWTTPMRQNMRIGRFIKKVVPDDDDRYIEDCTNEYKFSYNLNKTDFIRFKVYSGIDMAKWYLEFFYAPGGGSLHASCMKHVRSQRRLPIYTENPEKIKMLVIKSPEGKLLGRALLWKLDYPENKIYMDRVYSAEDYIDKLFYDYAKKKGFLTKIDVDKENINMRVNLRRDYGTPKHNPYMDTFKFFVRGKNYLTNRFKNFEADDYYEYVDHD